MLEKSNRKKRTASLDLDGKGSLYKPDEVTPIASVKAITGAGYLVDQNFTGTSGNVIVHRHNGYFYPGTSTCLRHDDPIRRAVVLRIEKLH